MTYISVTSQYTCGVFNITPYTPLLINIFLLFLYIFFITRGEYLKAALILVLKAINDIFFIKVVQACKYNGNANAIKMKTYSDVTFALTILLTITTITIYKL